jgi:hypothetical protein
LTLRAIKAPAESASCGGTKATSCGSRWQSPRPRRSKPGSNRAPDRNETGRDQDNRIVGPRLGRRALIVPRIAIRYDGSSWCVDGSALADEFARASGCRMGVVTRVIVDLERHENPISGTVRGESEADRPFVGWVGLLAALEAALGTDGQDGEDATSADPIG